LNAPEQHLSGMSLQADEARLLRGRRQTALWRLGITGEMDLIDDLSVERHGEVYQLPL
jgi:hypothetical protein